MTALLIILVVLWIAPILVAHDIGKKRNRTGWPYGLLLGWLGVLILSCTSYLPSDAERRIREFEAQRQLNNFEAHQVLAEQQKKVGVLGSFGIDR